MLSTTLSTTLSTLPSRAPGRASPVPSPSPSGPVSPGGCTPGQAGIPNNLYGHLMCGDYLRSLPHTAGVAVRAHAPLVIGLVVGVLAVRLAATWWRRRVWRQTAARAVWLHITPPVSATPQATHDLWNLLATLLPAPRLLRLHPPLRLVWEAHATPSGMRVGLWVPPGVNPSAVKRALQTCWPGVRTEQATPPGIAHQRPGFGVQLRATVPEWLPLVQDADPAPTSRFVAVPEADRIRAVYQGLAAAGRTGAGLVQVHVVRAPGYRVAVLRRAATDPRRARRPRGALRVVALLLAGVRAVVAAVLDLVAHNPTTSRRGQAGMDPVLAEQARHARVRHAAGPHLLIGIRAFATGPTTPAARAAAADITAGYSLLASHWRPRRLWRPATKAAYRWSGEAGMHVATTAEAAALAGLPNNPATYGLPAAPSRRLAPTRDTFTAPLVGGSRAARSTRAPRGESTPWRGTGGRPDEDPPAVWRTP